MSNNVEIEESEKKDHYLISVNGVSWGEWERSQVRQAIGVLDNGITVDIKARSVKGAEGGQDC